MTIGNKNTTPKLTTFVTINISAKLQISAHFVHVLGLFVKVHYKQEKRFFVFTMSDCHLTIIGLKLTVQNC